MNTVDQRSDSTFTTQELARLAVYRAAVLAGFYSDWDGAPEEAAPAEPSTPEPRPTSGSETPGEEPR
jgi:hypothetical protein